MSVKVYLMRNTILLSLLLLSAFISFNCKKTDENSVPGEYDQKVLVEEYTAEWCGFCGKAAPKYSEIVDKYQNEALIVAMHYSDILEVKYPATASYFYNFFDVNGIPSLMVNKKFDDTKEWIVHAESKMGYKSNAGIKIESSYDINTLNIAVSTTTNKEMNDVLLSVYLVEDHVPESKPGAQSGGGGNFVHRNVLREIFTAKTGDLIDLKTDSLITKNFSVNTSKYKQDDLRIMAFLTHNSSKSFEYINGNTVKAGKNTGW